MFERIFSSSELSAQDYHAEREHESSSNLRSILITPAHYQHKISEPQKDTEALRFGTVFHAAVLEPEIFDQQFAVSPKFDRRTTKGKAGYEAFLAAHPGRQILMAEDLDLFNKIRKQIVANPDVHKLLASPGQSESSIFWTDEETDVKLKIRPDRLFLLNDAPVYVSLKTAADASREAFSNDIYRYQYHVAEAMYADGITQAYGCPPTVIWVVFEKGNWLICKYVPSAATLERGHEEYRRALALLKQCRETNSYIGYQDIEQIEEISLPTRAFRNNKSALHLAA